jgi:two-component system NtrC family sensor kinase
MNTSDRVPTSSPVTVRAADRDLALEDLAYLNRMTTVGQVLPNVAHELNNALQIIGGIVEILSLRDSVPADVRDKMARIGTQATRATELLRELVTFSRRDDGGVTLVDVTRSVERALALRRYHLNRARIAVSVSASEPRQALARVDGNYLQQILLNLIINAEHSLVDRTDPRIDIRIRRTDDRIDVTIADNGHGVPPEAAHRVIEPFYTTKTSAAGLGLTVAAGLTRMLGGELVFSPGPEGGAAAVLTLAAAAPGS